MKALLKNNIANIFTGLRLILSVWLIFLTLYSSQLFLMFVLTLFCGLLDVLDGWAARRWQIQSAVGAFLDRLADKVFICPVIVILAWRYWPAIDIPQSLKYLTDGLVAVVILLEIILISSSVVGALKGLDVSSNKWGKRKMVFQSAAVLAWFLLLIFESHFQIKAVSLAIYWLINSIIIVAIVLAIKSIEGYCERYTHQEKQKEDERWKRCRS